MIFDTERNLAFNDAQIAVFAKAQIAGEATTLSRVDWATAIQARADDLYADRGMTKEARFAKAIGGMSRVERGSVYDGGDKLAKLYHEAYKAAPPAKPPEPEPVGDLAKAEAAKRGSASMQTLELARQHNAANPQLSEAQSYDRVYTSPKNIALKQKVLEENWSLAGMGDTAYNARNNPVGRASDCSNPHLGGSGPRP